MKSRFLLTLMLTNAFSVAYAADAGVLPSTNSLQSHLEQIARTNSYFSLTVIINARPLRLWPPMQVVTNINGVKTWKPGTDTVGAEQLHLLNELRALSGNREALAALLTNSDPKVRTLALGAIFQREDARDLPLIASLLNDSAPTFPDLHGPIGQGGAPTPIAKLESPQTVGGVAQRMLAFWGVEHEGRPVSPWPGGKNIITTKDFAAYWAKYAGRTYSASWFAVKMKRATRQTTPIQPQYQPEIQRVLAEMNALPTPDRAWTQLYVLAPGGWYVPDSEDLVVSPHALLDMIHGLGPDALLRFLQRQPVSDDPALQIDKDDSDFVRMSNFILLHADKLLRPRDADVVLACQYVLRNSGTVNPAWAIGAVLAAPARASEILHHALAGLNQHDELYEYDAGDFAGALWRIRGPAEMDFLVNWFYTAPPMLNDPDGQQIAFFWGVEPARPDTRQLMAALVKDPRFARTDWNALREFLETLNAARSTPLVNTQDIYAAAPNSLQNEKVVLAKWRNLLRHEYGLLEQPLPEAEARPEHILTRPLWSVPFVWPPVYAEPWQIVVSPDGQWLATFTNNIVALWNAAAGEFLWQVPLPGPIATRIAFQPGSGNLVIFDSDNYGQFSEWDVVSRQQLRRVSLTGKPTSGVGDGTFCFDPVGSEAAFAGYNDLVVFDVHSGKALWTHRGEGGGKCPIGFSADGTRLAVGGLSESPKAVKLYDAATGRLLRQFDQSASPVLALVLSSDGGKLATTSIADGVQLWDTATGKLLKEYAFQAWSWPRDTLAFSPDGQWLAVFGATDKIGESCIGILRVNTGELKWQIQCESDAAAGPMAFAPDARTFYTCGARLQAWSLSNDP